MSRLMPDGTAEPVSRDQILRHKRGLPFQLATSRIGNLTPLILTLAKYVMTILNTPSMCISRLSTEICFIETKPTIEGIASEEPAPDERPQENKKRV